MHNNEEHIKDMDQNHIGGGNPEHRENGRPETDHPENLSQDKTPEEEEGQEHK